MNPVFMDTVGLIALWDDSDQWHAAASAALAPLESHGRRLVTSSAVMLECGNSAARTVFRSTVVELRHRFAERGDLVVPSEAETERAWAAYLHAPLSGPSIIDCISFEVMRRVGATDAFTNDRHFAADGFTTLF